MWPKKGISWQKRRQFKELSRRSVSLQKGGDFIKEPDKKKAFYRNKQGGDFWRKTDKKEDTFWQKGGSFLRKTRWGKGILWQKGGDFRGNITGKKYFVTEEMFEETWQQEDTFWKKEEIFWGKPNRKRLLKERSWFPDGNLTERRYFMTEKRQFLKCDRKKTLSDRKRRWFSEEIWQKEAFWQKVAKVISYTPIQK